eukprot:GHVR01114686.1.p1 GENE.GHVR01114686.1~~GHVR01114686.1.p1  ORF type:complete len:485 (-),score=72.50 GHVR01114686.1:1242-2696(-)
MDEKCGSNVWDKFLRFMFLQAGSENDMRILYNTLSDTDMPIMIENGFDVNMYCTTIVNTDIDVIWDLFIIGIVKQLGPYSSQYWQKASILLTKGYETFEFNSDDEKCDHDVAHAFPWVVAESIKDYYDENDFLPGAKGFTKAAKFVINDVVDQLLGDDVKKKGMLSEKMDKMDILYGVPERNNMLHIYHSSYSLMDKPAIGKIFQSYNILIGRTQATKMINRVGKSANQQNRLSSLDTLSNNVVYNPHENSLFVPLALLYKDSKKRLNAHIDPDYSIGTDNVAPCEVAQRTAEYSAGIGRRIVRAMVEGLIMPYDSDGSPLKVSMFDPLKVSMFDPFHDSREMYRAKYINFTFGNKEQIGFALNEKHTHRIFFDALELHFSYYAAIQHVMDMGVVLQHCDNTFKKLFFHSNAIKHCEVYSYDVTKREMAIDLQYLPAEARLTYSYLVFPPFREAFSCISHEEEEEEEEEKEEDIDYKNHFSVFV